MSYSIRITRKAERDIEEAADHIEFELFNPQAADDLLDAVDESVSALSEFPKRHSLVDDSVLKSWGIRFFPVKNYLVFYVIVEDTVYIVRFLHQRRDWITILRRDGIEES